jgi:predicted RNase H-like nuclease (RuvC/YqgF family)
MQRKEKKLEELYEQVSVVEREKTRLREVVIRLEEENKKVATEREEVRIEVTELRKHCEIYEEKLQQQQAMRDEKLTAHMATIKELEAQLDQRSQRLRDV